MRLLAGSFLLVYVCVCVCVCVCVIGSPGRSKECRAREGWGKKAGKEPPWGRREGAVLCDDDSHIQSLVSLRKLSGGLPWHRRFHPLRRLSV